MVVGIGDRDVEGTGHGALAQDPCSMCGPVPLRLFCCNDINSNTFCTLMKAHCFLCVDLKGRGWKSYEVY